MKKADIAAVLAVLAAAVLTAVLFHVIASRQEQGTAVIYLDGKQIRTVQLDTDGEFTVGGAYENTITVRDGRIAVTASDCPGEDCVHTGWISRAGSSIICLPNRLEIRITGSDVPDGVAQ